MIEKRGGKFVVLDHTGQRVLGTHASQEDALRQLRAIEIAKHAASKVNMWKGH